jgi:chromosome segregation ATPase
VLTQEQHRLDESRAELAGINSELAALKKRLAELARRRDTTQRSVALRDVRVQKLRSTYKRECTASESCQQYENLAGSLERQAAEIEREVAAARAEISRSSTESAQLGREIEPLRREYADLKCNHLVPGSTAQSTIDRCATIFSQWNRLQARVNQLNNHLAPLRSHYQRLLSRLRQIEEHGRGYADYLSRNCKSSPQLAKVRGFGAVRLRAEKLGRELDKLIDDAAKLRSIEITVTAKP